MGLLNALDFLAASLSLYVLVTFCGHITRRGHPYPPGPLSWPIVGNLFDVPKEAPWIAYRDMCKKYGTCDILVAPILQN